MTSVCKGVATGANTSLPFRGCFFADMGKTRLHLSEPFAGFAFPMRYFAVHGLLRDLCEVFQDARKVACQTSQCFPPGPGHAESTKTRLALWRDTFGLNFRL